jgi:hypothetical protein
MKSISNALTSFIVFILSLSLIETIMAVIYTTISTVILSDKQNCQSR